jgi:hypothetical protein
MLMVDNNVQNPFNTQHFNRYSYVFNNPLKYTDPDGELPFFVPIIIGAIVGAEVGGWISSGTPEPWKWENNDWIAAGTGAMVGAGVGLGVSAIASRSGSNITGIYKGDGGIGATTLGWDITVNALMTSNINMGSSWAQGRDLNEIFLSGVSGLAAGGIGGGIGRLFNKSSRIDLMSTQGIRATNFITGGLNGGLDRLTNSIYNGEEKSQIIANTFFGIGEGVYSAYFSSKDRIVNLKGKSLERLAGRYVSGAFSQAITSVPGLGVFIASYHASYYGALSFGNENARGYASILALLGTPSGWIINRFWYSSAIVNPLFFFQK